MKQLIKCPTRVTCNSSSILDHVLASFPDSFSRSDVINGGISDHQLIYCTRKDARIKNYCYKQITLRSLKNYSPEVYEEDPTKLGFPNYELFDDIDKAYENFIQKVITVIDNLTPSKNKHIKVTSQDRFHAEIMEKKGISFSEKRGMEKKGISFSERLKESIKITIWKQGMR